MMRRPAAATMPRNDSTLAVTTVAQTLTDL